GLPRRRSERDDQQPGEDGDEGNQERGPRGDGAADRTRHAPVLPHRRPRNEDGPVAHPFGGLVVAQRHRESSERHGRSSLCWRSSSPRESAPSPPIPNPPAIAATHARTNKITVKAIMHRWSAAGALVASGSNATFH